ncbi:MAG: hypothetical protein LBU65_05790 [Planctomycetaceae bacterium]|jgi:hypothetical protein|nr:hypothetical protein [Planctomycetaceae bacterium]
MKNRLIGFLIIVVCSLFTCGNVFSQYQFSSPLPDGTAYRRYPVPTHNTHTNAVMRRSEVAPHDPPAPSIYTVPAFDRNVTTNSITATARQSAQKFACGKCAGCLANKGCIAHSGMAGPCDIPSTMNTAVDINGGALGADDKHTCGKPCDEHLDLYGYPLQYVYGKEEPKRRLLLPHEEYPGTSGRQAWAYTFGYSDASQNYRFYKPAAYMSHEYVAAINRAVWEQLDAKRSRDAYAAALDDIEIVRQELELAKAKVDEWQKYCDEIMIANGFQPGAKLICCPHSVQACCNSPCREAGTDCVNNSRNCSRASCTCCPICHEILVALSWLGVAKATLAQAEADVETGNWLVNERREYMEFAVERARNSKRTANMSAFHQRVLVKPPLKRADPEKQEQAQQEYKPQG